MAPVGNGITHRGHWSGHFWWRHEWWCSRQVLATDLLDYVLLDPRMKTGPWSSPWPLFTLYVSLLQLESANNALKDYVRFIFAPHFLFCSRHNYNKSRHFFHYFPHMHLCDIQQLFIHTSKSNLKSNSMHVPFTSNLWLKCVLTSKKSEWIPSFWYSLRIISVV